MTNPEAGDGRSPLEAAEAGDVVSAVSLGRGGQRPGRLSVPGGAEGIPWPGDRPDELPELRGGPLEQAWRLHWEDDPTLERRHPTGRYRFDAPAGEFGVTYVGDDPLAVFAETYAKALACWPRPKPDASAAGCRSTRPLQLLPMDAMTVAAAFGLDNRISTEKPYARTQAWSAAWHSWYPRARRPRVSRAQERPAAHLLPVLDRCADALEFELEGTLEALRTDGLRACYRYRITPALYF